MTWQRLSIPKVKVKRAAFSLVLMKKGVMLLKKAKYVKRGVMFMKAKYVSWVLLAEVNSEYIVSLGQI